MRFAGELKKPNGEWQQRLWVSTKRVVTFILTCGNCRMSEFRGLRARHRPRFRRITVRSNRRSKQFRTLPLETFRRATHRLRSRPRSHLDITSSSRYRGNKLTYRRQLLPLYQPASRTPTEASSSQRRLTPELSFRGSEECN
jgi:hypothetical protein